MPASRKEDKSDKQIRDLAIQIADLYRVTGKNKAAAEQYKRLLSKYSNHNFSTSKRAIKLRGIFSLRLYFFMINNQKLFFRKKMYEGIDIFMKMTYGLGTSLITMDTRRFALECSPLMVVVSYYDFRNSRLALQTFLASSGLFNMTGISFKTSQKMIDFVEVAGLEKDPYGFNTVRMIKKMQLYYTGIWSRDEDQQHVINHGIRKGNFWDTEIYLTYCSLVYIELGDYQEFLDLKDKLFDMADSFDDNLSGSQAYRIMSIGHIKFRKFDEFQTIVDEGTKYIMGTENSAISLVFFSMKAQLYYYLGDFKTAEIAITEAEKLKFAIMNVPVYHTQYLLSKVKLEFEKLQTLPKTSKNFKPILKEQKKNIKKLISQSKKMIGNLTEAYLLKAKYYLFFKKYKKTLKYFKLAIATSEKHNGRLELSRAYFEMGKFLTNPNTKQTQLNGLSGKDLLDKAKTMFEEMDLQWDLEEYGKYQEGL